MKYAKHPQCSFPYSDEFYFFLWFLLMTLSQGNRTSQDTWLMNDEYVGIELLRITSNQSEEKKKNDFKNKLVN